MSIFVDPTNQSEHQPISKYQIMALKINQNF